MSFNGPKSVEAAELPLKALMQSDAQVLEVVSRYYGRVLAAKQHQAEAG